MPPQIQIYPLSVAEQLTMEKYVAESLKQGYIDAHPWHQPAASSLKRRPEVFDLVSTTEDLIEYLFIIPTRCHSFPPH